MRQIPDAITPAILAANANKTDEQIQGDIDTTRHEIESLRKVEEAFRLLAQYHLNPNQRQLYAFHADGQPKEIADREAFVAFLSRLLATRHGRRCSVMTAVVLPE
jgi:hypothetical protein